MSVVALVSNYMIFRAERVITANICIQHVTLREDQQW